MSKLLNYKSICHFEQSREIFLAIFILFSTFSFAQKSSYQIALLKYNGGGDWYANLETSLPNLIKFCNQNLKTNIIFTHFG